MVSQVPRGMECCVHELILGRLLGTMAFIEVLILIFATYLIFQGG